MPPIDDDFQPTIFLKHFRGGTHAAFSNANGALACQRGLEADPDRRVAGWFHFEDENGEKIILKANPSHPGHAYSILESLERADEAKRKAEAEPEMSGPSWPTEEAR